MRFCDILILIKTYLYRLIMEEQKNKKVPMRRITIDLPVVFFSRINRMREDSFANGEKVTVRDIIQRALNALSRELDYPEIN